jgi:hypothetical protein
VVFGGVGFAEPPQAPQAEIFFFRNVKWVIFSGKSPYQGFDFCRVGFAFRMAVPSAYTVEEQLLFVDIEKNKVSVTGRHSATLRRLSVICKLPTDRIMRAFVFLMHPSWTLTSNACRGLELRKWSVSSLRDEVPVTLTKMELELGDWVYCDGSARCAG